MEPSLPGKCRLGRIPNNRNGGPTSVLSPWFIHRLTLMSPFPPPKLGDAPRKILARKNTRRLPAAPDMGGPIGARCCRVCRHIGCHLVGSDRHDFDYRSAYPRCPVSSGQCAPISFG